MLSRITINRGPPLQQYIISLNSLPLITCNPNTRILKILFLPCLKILFMVGVTKTKHLQRYTYCHNSTVVDSKNCDDKYNANANRTCGMIALYLCVVNMHYSTDSKQILKSFHNTLKL